MIQGTTGVASNIRTNYIELNVTSSAVKSINTISCGNMLQNQVCQLNWTINASGGVGSQLVIDVNFSSDNANVVANDTQDHLIKIVSAANSCSCPSSGDWGINLADNCVITADCDMKGNNVYAYGSGSLTINALIYNFKRFAAHGGTIACIRQAGCFG